MILVPAVAGLSTRSVAWASRPQPYRFDLLHTHVTPAAKPSTAAQLNWIIDRPLF